VASQGQCCILDVKRLSIKNNGRAKILVNRFIWLVNVYIKNSSKHNHYSYFVDVSVSIIDLHQKKLVLVLPVLDTTRT